jgi:hypothetical protein
MAVPYTFSSATSAIPLSQLDSNFATAITIGNVAIQLGNTVTTIGNVTLSNPTLNNATMANVTINSVTSTFPNNYLSNNSVIIGNTSVALGGTASTVGNLTLTNTTVSSVSTPITAAQGGTGLTSITANNVMLGNGTSAVQIVAPGTTGNVLTSNGTTWLSQVGGGSTTGTVIQVITASTSTQASSANSTFVSTGLSATITPQYSTSKILVIVSQHIFASAPQGQASLRIVRGSTAVGPTYDYANWGQTSQFMVNISIQAYDSPATTSATTYTSQMRLNGGVPTIYAQYGDGGGQGSSFMTLMEIK